MELDWILLGLLGWAVANLLALALMHMAGRQDNIARRAEMENGPGPSPLPSARRPREERRCATRFDGTDPIAVEGCESRSTHEPFARTGGSAGQRHRTPGSDRGVRGESGDAALRAPSAPMSDPEAEGARPRFDRMIGAVIPYFLPRTVARISDSPSRLAPM